jgi:N-acetylmuramoyl-L-alanine amidase
MRHTKKLTADEVKFIAIHCADTTSTMDTDISDIDRWHRERGFSSVGYHYFIKRGGLIQHGRSVEQHGIHLFEASFEQGAQVEDYNRCSIGVCLAGGRGADGQAQNNFTAAQFASLVNLLTQLKEWFPNAVIQGHRDFPGVTKKCPSFDVRTWCKANFII